MNKDESAATPPDQHAVTEPDYGSPRRENEQSKADAQDTQRAVVPPVPPEPPEPPDRMYAYVWRTGTIAEWMPSLTPGCNDEDIEYAHLAPIQEALEACEAHMINDPNDNGYDIRKSDWDALGAAVTGVK